MGLQPCTQSALKQILKTISFWKLSSGNDLNLLDCLWKFSFFFFRSEQVGGMISFQILNITWILQSLRSDLLSEYGRSCVQDASLPDLIEISSLICHRSPGSFDPHTGADHYLWFSPFQLLSRQSDRARDRGKVGESGAVPIVTQLNASGHKLFPAHICLYFRSQSPPYQSSPCKWSLISEVDLWSTSV